MHLPILDNNEQNIGLRRNASSVSVSNMHSEMAHHHRSNSSMEELHYGMAGKPRVWQPLKHRGLKIDTSSSLMRPSPLRRAASENCVTASLARELEHSMHADMSQMSAHNGFPNGRARFAASPTRLAMPKFRIGSPGPRSPVTEVPSPLHPVPPPNEHSIPAANELNLYNIAMGYDTRTTFMIRNIPNKYTQEMLIAFLNRTHKGQFDFLYLRMDFKNRCNVGYAFINFNGSAAVLSFAERVVGKKWSKFNSDKVCTLSYANIQGRNALIQKFRNSSVMLEAHDWRPKIFLTEGPCAGEEEPFPPPTMAIRPRSDVLFSRDNAGLPHRGNSVNEGRGSPRKVSFDDFDGQVGQWPKPSRGDQTCDSPVSRSQSRSSLNSASIDDLDFSKLTLGDDIVPSVVGNEKENGSLQAPPQWGDQPLAGNMSLPGIVDGVSHQQMAASWALS
ncbi:RNA recognition motif 2-domain-containing protein [Fimicolochytrium jonesii]|uniref:RNA recognition motif 2-domain-containing protein n=1 Tax=Fimicolochytrium jonesii TaxID=1396493 RepID=UPI0022FE9EBC|nr:RNA recognition motif 2-domain-containing protein [Fimicolochytrium jonesii]KAI8817912.1 RNA recognition motif 2-domain-containing protein [Fimicolochytrium jonesii]